MNLRTDPVSHSVQLLRAYFFLKSLLNTKLMFIELQLKYEREKKVIHVYRVNPLTNKFIYVITFITAALFQTYSST